MFVTDRYVDEYFLELAPGDWTRMYESGGTQPHVLSIKVLDWYCMDADDGFARRFTQTVTYLAFCARSGVVPAAFLWEAMDEHALNFAESDLRLRVASNVILGRWREKTASR